MTREQKIEQIKWLEGDINHNKLMVSTCKEDPEFLFLISMFESYIEKSQTKLTKLTQEVYSNHYKLLEGLED